MIEAKSNQYIANVLHSQNDSLHSRCRGGTMYGMLLESIQHFIQTVYSVDSWNQVLEEIGLAHAEFVTHNRYNDEIMVNLAAACSQVIGIRSRDQWLHYFGRCFVEYFTHYGYDVILRVSGRHFRDFLHGIDNLHETMRFSFPKMISPSFYVSQEDRDGCLLHYRSKRVGFTEYVLGQLKQCAKQFYNVMVDITVVQEEADETGRHVVLRLDFDNSPFLISKEREKHPGSLQFPFISAKIFFQVFPFSLVFDQSLTVIHAGQTVQKLFQPSNIIGQRILTFFCLRRPQMLFTWENVHRLQKVVFELQTLKTVYYTKDGDEDHPNQQGVATRHLLLKGQMRYVDDFQGMAFMCTPLLGDIEHMHSLGLYINDLNMFDTSRDMVLAGWHHASRLEYSIEKQLEHSEQIRANLLEVDSWKQRSEALLYSMMPKHIATRLQHGEDPINTCQALEKVTVLFSYLLGFHEMVSSVAPLQLVECVNSVFIVFDGIVDKHNVFKVETLGDAVYMVAGGVLETRQHQTQQVADVALEFMEKVREIMLPDTKQSLQLREGIHTGSVVAGVIGKRMPQYCLFGDTVNTASRMQTYSEPGHIHISQTCQDGLQGTDYVTMSRGKVNIKGKGEMRTYWLIGKRSDPDITTKVRLFRSHHALSLELQTRRSNDLNLRLLRNKSEACMFSLVPSTPKDSSARSRAHTPSTRSRAPSEDRGSRSDTVMDEEGSLQLGDSKSQSTSPLNYIEEDQSSQVHDSSLDFDSDLRENDESLDSNPDVRDIEKVIQGDNEQLEESHKQLEPVELPLKPKWYIGVDTPHSVVASDIKDGVCPFGFDDNGGIMSNMEAPEHDPAERLDFGLKLRNISGSSFPRRDSDGRGHSGQHAAAQSEPDLQGYKVAQEVQICLLNQTSNQPEVCVTREHFTANDLKQDHANNTCTRDNVNVANDCRTRTLPLKNPCRSGNLRHVTSLLDTIQSDLQRPRFTSSHESLLTLRCDTPTRSDNILLGRHVNAPHSNHLLGVRYDHARNVHSLLEVGRRASTSHSDCLLGVEKRDWFSHSDTGAAPDKD